MPLIQKSRWQHWLRAKAICDIPIFCTWCVRILAKLADKLANRRICFLPRIWVWAVKGSRQAQSVFPICNLIVKCINLIVKKLIVKFLCWAWSSGYRWDSAAWPLRSKVHCQNTWLIFWRAVKLYGKRLCSDSNNCLGWAEAYYMDIFVFTAEVKSIHENRRGTNNPSKRLCCTLPSCHGATNWACTLSQWMSFWVLLGYI